MNWFLVALVFSSWDGHIIAQTKMAVYKTEKQCLDAVVKMRHITPRQVKCVENAIQFDERLNK